ncbi:hypothetical protein SCAR479_12158 [Seiridium cardinale]|uniref:Zn(2)-C6 fungal-type domain-containing protein n=1 Tax=Seiridium cardinale TaxID=138064 RepID=A0ABR2XC31_9PEZI
MSTPWRRACAGCTKAKRQCTKQVPSCRRCIHRGIECEYPPARRIAAPSSLPPAVEIGSSAALTQTSDQPGSIDDLLVDDIDFDYTLLDVDPDLSTTVPDPVDITGHAVPDVSGNNGNPESSALWFLVPSSWEHEHSIPRAPDVVSTSSLDACIKTIRNWFFAWASGPSPTQSNPLFHPELYRREMPRCVQDAYTAVSTYHHRTPANKETVLRILEARTEQLVQEQALRETLGNELTMFEHLARVHALLAYQIIRLFDGDIRARAQAEDMVDTLFKWCEAMWWSARRAQENRPFHHPQHGLVSTTASLHGPGENTASGEMDLWHTFVHLESVRRVFLTASIVQHIFLTLKRGWSGCPGGVTISIRRGVWDAKSAYSWEKLVGRGKDDPLLGLQSMRLDHVLSEAPVEVDDFGLAIIRVHYGAERLEQWLNEKVGRAERDDMAMLLGVDSGMY